MKITPSMLSAYLYCPRKLFLNYVLKLKEPPKDSLVKGTIRHETYDRINKTEESIVTSIGQKTSFNALCGIYKNHYMMLLREVILKNNQAIKSVNLTASNVFETAYPYILDESRARAFNIRNFIEKHSLYGEELWEALTPKIKSEIRIESDRLNLKGVVDQVEVYKDDMVPLELKTGKAPADGIWPGHRIQLGAYVLLLEEHFNTEIKEGFVVYLDAKQRRHITVNPFLRFEVKELIGKVQQILSSAELPKHLDNMNKCNPCGIKEECYNRSLMQNKMEKLLAITTNSPKK